MANENILTQDMQCVETARMVFKGMSLFFGMLADSMNGDVNTAAVPAKTQPVENTVSKTTEAPADNKPETAESKKPDPMPAESNITHKDVQRAMAVKIKELAKRGEDVDKVGDLFPQFHGASCVSELNVDDYPAFLAELNKL